MRTPIQFFVTGDPKSQPRARSRQYGKGVYNPDTADGWKSCIRADWKTLNQPAWEGPIKVSLTFTFARPKNHFGSGKKASILKESAPHWHTKKPDRDNLDKAVMDALTNAGAWGDDCQVCAGSIRKVWGTCPGVRITISEAEDALPQARLSIALK